MITGRITRSGLGVLVSSLAIAAIISGIFWRFYFYHPQHHLPYHDSFAANIADEWQGFGGTWSIVDGTMRNDSDDRGAKLLAGSTKWKNYVLSGDVKLLGTDGDAGFIVRSSNEEEGVDSYSGYYAGLRTRDNRLILGRANHDWKEVQSVLIQGGTQAFQWYHLQIVTYGCTIVVSASPISNPAAITAVSLSDKNCLRSGRIGLRSYSSGGAWKDVQVRVATAGDLRNALLQVPAQRKGLGKESNSDLPYFGSGSRPSSTNLPLPAPASSVQAINSLSLITPQTKVTIRGVVILAKPLYVQDPTGGVAVSAKSLAPLKIGDEVQVTGYVDPGYYSTRIQNSTVNALWSHTPVPPFSTTSAQAASGSFDDMFIELEGTLQRKTKAPDNNLVLDLESNQQPFQAIVNLRRGDHLLQDVELNSTVRLRGISVSDPQYTHERFPFVLLMRSADDLEVLSGPPWWNTRHVVLLSVVLLILILIALYMQNRIEHWRWRTILEERENLAHEIHDTLAQSFAGLGFQLEAIRDRVPADIPLVHEQLDLACDLVRRSHQEARRSVVALRRDSDSTLDLLTTLERCARKMVDRCCVVVSATQSGDVRVLPAALSDALFRIGQEAISNSVRHAQPTRISIAICYRDNEVQLTVEDNGIGFEMGHESAGFGLQGIQRRTRGVTGIAQIISSPGMGTRVTVTAPIPRSRRWFEWPLTLWHTYGRYRSYAQTRKQMHSRPDRG